MLDAILDKSVVGYTALGYRLRSHPAIKADLAGRVAVVTGATSGLGRETAKELARLGATVIIVGRTLGRIAAALSQAHETLAAHPSAGC